jgi:hypothetical protein
MILHLKPLIGINELTFGALPSEVVKIFGEAEEIEELNDEILNDQVLIYHYWEKGVSFFFSNQQHKLLSTIVVDNKNAIIFGEKIFDLNEKEIIALFKKNNLIITEKDNHPWGEKSISFDTINLDLYFSNGKLNSINYGVVESDQPLTYFPN